jgi:hypothetical protein
MKRRGVAGCFAAAVAALALALPTGALGAGDPAGCTTTLQYDPSIPTFAQYAAEKGLTNATLGGFNTGTTNRHLTAELYGYEEAIATATAANPRVRVLVHNMGTTVGGRPFQYSVVGTPEHIADLEGDAAFWRNVRDGVTSEASALATLRSDDPPAAFGWITETPHGNEPAGGEASMRMLYELAAREDCANMRRLATMDFFIDPARNPDGRDNNTRTTAWAYDPNRDLMYQTQDVNRVPLDTFFQYPGLFFIDAHQQSTGYFFPPNEDPVHHEISHFALNEIQDVIGPALQSRFNDQSLQYRNYNQYDLFTPEYGDSVPSLILGSAGMTYEKGSSEAYGKQVYDHYLAMDETASVVSEEEEPLAEAWVKQWTEAAEQGSGCEVQPNVLVSPLHETIEQQPNIDICGYYFKPGNHSGDVAEVIKLLQDRSVHVYKLNSAVTVTGAHDWGTGAGGTTTTTETLPAGTLWIPTAQTMKHWINATLEENPYIPYPYYYDVVNWAFSELADLGGNGQLQAALPEGTSMTEIAAPELGGVSGGSGKQVYAFSTDSTQALGLLTELLSKGATVYRSKTAFEAEGVSFPTGTALVDASFPNAGELPELAVERQTPVVGLSGYPTARYQIAKPKIAIYTGGATVQTNPMYPGTGTGQCTSNTAFCEALYTLAKMDDIPASLLTPMTSTELAAGALGTGGYTAFVNPNFTIAAGAGATALQAFVNSGGNVLTYGANGIVSSANAGVSKIEAMTSKELKEGVFLPHCPNSTEPTTTGTLTTPGTAFSAEFNTSNPIAWGFDAGGYIFRDASTNPVIKTSSFIESGAIPAPSAAVSFPASLRAYGYSCNAVNSGQLPGRPYAADQPFGAGHNTIVLSDPFFRSWNTGAQRLVINAMLYPNTAVIPVSAPPATRKVVLADKPLSRSQLKKIRKRVVPQSTPAFHSPLSDAVVIVKASKAKALHKVVRRAHLPRKVRKHVRWSKGPGKHRVTLRIVGAANFPRNTPGDPKVKGAELWVHNDLELRPTWAWRIIQGLVKRHIHPIQHEI